MKGGHNSTLKLVYVPLGYRHRVPPFLFIAVHGYGQPATRDVSNTAGTIIRGGGRRWLASWAPEGFETDARRDGFAASITKIAMARRCKGSASASLVRVAVPAFAQSHRR